MSSLTIRERGSSLRGRSSGRSGSSRAEVAMAVHSVTRCGSTPHARANSRTTRTSLSSSSSSDHAIWNISSSSRSRWTSVGGGSISAGRRTRMSSGASGGRPRAAAALREHLEIVRRSPRRPTPRRTRARAARRAVRPRGATRRPARSAAPRVGGGAARVAARRASASLDDGRRRRAAAALAVARREEVVHHVERRLDGLAARQRGEDARGRRQDEVGLDQLAGRREPLLRAPTRRARARAPPRSRARAAASPPSPADAPQSRHRYAVRRASPDPMSRRAHPRRDTTGSRRGRRTRSAGATAGRARRTRPDATTQRRSAGTDPRQRRISRLRGERAGAFRAVCSFRHP